MTSGQGMTSNQAVVDKSLSAVIDDQTRAGIWESVGSILEHGPLVEPANSGAIGLALGYVQSGKTSSIVALTAAAADQGYRVVIALLGTTNLLLDQNRDRIEGDLGIPTRTDYQWVVQPDINGRAGTNTLKEWLNRGRTILVPILKHAGRIRGVADACSRLDLAEVPVLIIDDEADQASLNTSPNSRQSSTYKAISTLRDALPKHLYVQYTATPYAPFLLQPDDHLLPEFVEFLNPGPGYVGGREFFVDHADIVLRHVPALEEQKARVPPSELPASLETALASFVAGAALLFGNEPSAAPVSMLVHSTQSTSIQDDYHHLIKKRINRWRDHTTDATKPDHLPPEIIKQRQRIVGKGAPDISDASFVEGVRHVVSEATLWLINSVSDQDNVNWLLAPVHILVGGNKLDRGFTIEGLTVSYMNRPTSPQVDTMEQRARAFGYRQDQLPYCQFFATKRTMNVLRDIVYTEYDLRAQLRDHLEEGGTIGSWAKEIGLLLPEGTKPTRPAVVKALSQTNTGWQSLRQPALRDTARRFNGALIEELGLLEAPLVPYGRQEFRTIEVPLGDLVERVLRPWQTLSYSPGWRQQDILDALERNPHQERLVPVLLMDESGRPRQRKWDDGLGFVNLFQGRDVRSVPGVPSYLGDRHTPDIENNPDRIVLQIHRVERRGRNDGFEVLAPAVYLGQRPIAKRR